MHRQLTVLLRGLVLTWTLGLSYTVSSAWAGPRATADDAVSLVRQAAAFLKANGKEKAFAAFDDPHGQFVKGELYLFVYSTNGDGIVLAHGQNSRMIGKHLIDMKDVNGIALIREATAIANSPSGTGWVKYSWPNSVSQSVEKKQSYVERVGDVWIGCGIYQ